MTDIELITQPVKYTYLKLTLMNSAYQAEQEIQGDMIDHSVTITAESDVRRVCSLTMHIENEQQLVEEFFGAWLDKMVQVHYGILDTELNEIKWFLIGTMLFTSSSYVIDAQNKRLSLQMGDMSTQMLEQRGSQLGTAMKYPLGSNIKNALDATVARFSDYKRTDICEFEDVVPYDIEISRGSYPWQATTTLVNLFPWYEQFYSKEGIYTVQKIPTMMTEDVVMGAEDMKKLVISENGDADYSAVKNCTEIWGKEIDANYTALNCNSVGDTYTLQLDIDVYEYGSLICFTPDIDCVNGQKIRANDLATYPIVKEVAGEMTPVQSKDLVAGRAYVVKYKNERFELQGETQIHVMCMEYNEMPSATHIEGLKAFHNCNDIQIVVEPTSLFACDKIGVVKQVLEGGDYANIYTTKLGYDRASYENWKKTRLMDSVRLEMLYVPWLDVNQKVEYELIGTGEVNQYLIQEIQVSPSSGVMQIRMVRFVPLYPWLE